MKSNFTYVFLVGTVLISCFPTRVLKYNVADINDLNKFDKVSISNNPDHIFKFSQARSDQELKLPEYLALNNVVEFDRFIEKSKTVAFLVIKNDTILYEKYFDDYEEDTPVPSFSVSKSFVSTLLGIAIDEGYINSTEDAITQYISVFQDEKMGKVTIQHVLDMQAGFKFGENYLNPFSEVAKYYYGRDILKFISELKTKEEPGKKFTYQSVNTQVLALIIERATKKTMAQFLEEKIWKPLQMEYNASWNVDDKGTIKAFCCINAKARDFAKLGRLYLNNGNWNGKQIVSPEWVDKTLYFTKEINDFMYSNHWWHSVEEMPYSDTVDIDKFNCIYKIKTDKKGIKKSIIYPSGDSFARGVLGQHIYINPNKNIIIIRLGKGFGSTDWTKLLSNLAKVN